MDLFDVYEQDATDLGLGVEPYLTETSSHRERLVASLERSGYRRRDPDGWVFDLPPTLGGAAVIHVRQVENPFARAFRVLRS